MVTNSARPAHKRAVQARRHVGHGQQFFSVFEQFVLQLAGEIGLEVRRPAESPKNIDEERVSFEAGENLYLGLKSTDRLFEKSEKKHILPTEVVDTLRARIIVENNRAIEILRNAFGARRRFARFFKDWEEGNSGSSGLVIYVEHDDKFFRPNQRGHMDFKIVVAVKADKKGWEPVLGEIQVVHADMMPAYFATHGLYELERQISARVARRTDVDPDAHLDQIRKIEIAATKAKRELTADELEQIILLREEGDTINNNKILSDERSDIEEYRNWALRINRRLAILGKNRVHLLNDPNYSTKFDRELEDERGRRERESKTGRAAALDVGGKAATSVPVSRPVADRKPRGP